MKGFTLTVHEGGFLGLYHGTTYVGYFTTLAKAKAAAAKWMKFGGGS